jgi:hypothetical protein
MRNKYLKKYADLHIHSTYSDGTWTPEEIFGFAKKKGLHCVSITDHDTLINVPEIQKAAERYNIEYIPGIEFSVDWEKSVHILAYYIDYNNQELKKLLRVSQENRINRIEEIIDRLKKIGLAVDYEEFLNLFKFTTPGRPHIAKYLIKKKIVKDFDEAFDKYIGSGKPGNVPKKNIGLNETLELINNAKGISVLAHPITLEDDILVEKLFRENKVEGIEAYYIMHNPNDVKYYKSIAEKYKLLVTGGSDCHGTGKDRIYMGKIKLKYDYVNELKKCYEQKYL